MEFKFFFGIASSVVAVYAFLPYVRDIVKRQTEPHMYSWLVWTTLQTVGVSAAFEDGGGYGTWALAIGTAFCLTIFLLSFRYGTKNITRFDGVCLGAALLTIAAYFSLDNPLWAVVMVALIDFFGFLPTFRKGWQEPYTETVTTYAVFALANILSLFALQHYTVVTVLYVTSLLVTNSFFVIITLMRRKVLSGAETLAKMV